MLKGQFVNHFGFKEYLEDMYVHAIIVGFWTISLGFTKSAVSAIVFFFFRETVSYTFSFFF